MLRDWIFLFWLIPGQLIGTPIYLGVASFEPRPTQNHVVVCVNKVESDLVRVSMDQDREFCSFSPDLSSIILDRFSVDSIDLVGRLFVNPWYIMVIDKSWVDDVNSTS